MPRFAARMAGERVDRLMMAAGVTPAQLARDAEFAGEDPLSHNDWIYAYDAEHAAAAAIAAG